MAFYLLIVGALICALLAEKTNRKIFLFILVLSVSLFMGLRDVSVGVDTYSYYNIFSNIQRGIISSNVEIGFSLLVKGIFLITDKIQYVFVVISLITNILIICRLWNLRSNCSFVYMIFLYMILYYPQSDNIIRQFLAMAIVFATSILVEKKRYVMFVLCVLGAMSIHTASVLALSYIPLYIFFAEGVEHNKNIKRLLAILFIIPVAGYFGVMTLNRYRHLMEGVVGGGLGLMNILKLGVLTVFIFSNYRVYRRHHYSLIEQGSENFGAITFICFLGTCSSFLGYYLSTMTRISYYYLLFEIPFIAYVSKNGKNRKFFKFVYIIYVLAYVVINASSGWSGLSFYKMATF